MLAITGHLILVKHTAILRMSIETIILAVIVRVIWSYHMAGAHCPSLSSGQCTFTDLNDIRDTPYNTHSVAVESFRFFLNDFQGNRFSYSHFCFIKSIIFPNELSLWTPVCMKFVDYCEIRLSTPHKSSNSIPSCKMVWSVETRFVRSGVTSSLHRAVERILERA